MARKISVAMRKGGSGKTTTTINLGAALAKRGKKVLLVDMDPQANASLAVGVIPHNVPHHIGDLLSNPDLSVNKALYNIGGELIYHIIPSHPDLAKVEVSMTPTDVHSLKNLLDQVERFYDYILIDTPPSESLLTINALTYAEEVILTLQAHYLAMEGMAQAIEQIDKVKRGLNPKIKIIGILPTMVNSRTNISKTVIETARERHPDLVYPFSVEFSVRHPEATLEGVPIVFYDPNHAGAQAYMKLAEEIEGHE